MTDDDDVSRQEGPTRPEPRVYGDDEQSLGTLLDRPGVRTVERTLGYECLSGGYVDAVWRGVPLMDVVDAVGFPAETTHLVVESRDGYRSCVGIRVAIEGLLAFERNDDRLAAPRFLAPEIEGPRAVKDVVALRPVSLDPDEERTDYESKAKDAEDGD